MRESVENLVTLFENGTLNRQQLIQGLLAVMAQISMVAHADADTSTTSAFRGRALNHVTLSVADVERSQEFYSRRGSSARKGYPFQIRVGLNFLFGQWLDDKRLLRYRRRCQ